MSKFVLFYTVVIILTVLFCYVPAEGSRRATQSDQLKFYEHITKVNSFTCGVPQQRTVKLEELGITPADDEQYIPSTTVLKRCHCAGYCATSGRECKPDTTSVVELVFKVVKHVGVEQMQYRKYNATEHDTCSCNN